jgi:large subunit ribosomal protein L31
MKANTHPKWNHQAVVKCACGNTFNTGSQQDEIIVEICDKCHPFFTGEQKFVDTKGRVDKFMQKMAKAKKIQANQTQNDKGQAKKKQAEDRKTYKQLLAEQKSELQKAA